MNSIINNQYMQLNVIFMLVMIYNEPYLIEVNTRMSGGIYKSSCFAGVNFPYLAIQVLQGKDETPKSYIMISRFI